MSLMIDMSELPAGVVEEFRKGRVAREALTLAQAPVSQAQIARQFQTDNRSVDGLGRLRLAISADAFHYWGRREGYDCWRDKQFIREFERDNPAARVKCVGTKLQVGWQPEAKRFSKTYNDPKTRDGNH